MNTILNNPPGNSSDSAFGFVVGVILVIILVILFLAYGVPGVWPRPTTPTPTPGQTTNTTNNEDSGASVIIPSGASGTVEINY